MPNIIPVINPKNLEDLKKKVKILKNFKETVQIDLSDGKFASWKNYTNISKIKDQKIPFPFEIHCMFNDPEKILIDLIYLKPKTIILHLEAIKDFNFCLNLCKENDIELALAICPKTKVETLFPYLKNLKTVLLLSVNPGISGQKIQLDVLEKALILKKKSPKISIELDGGVNEKNIKDLLRSGIHSFAIGSAIFNAKKPLLAIEQLNTLIK